MAAGQKHGPGAGLSFLVLTIIVPVLLIQFYDLTFWWEYGNGRGLQGRYWLGTIIPMLTFFYPRPALSHAQTVAQYASCQPAPGHAHLQHRRAAGLCHTTLLFIAGCASERPPISNF
ncbi:MAG: hypothetical protein M5U34_49275 [Chloroflexi bacterium]|nr:hypothetical protein [Chloroflexota bacterium]